LSPAGRLAQW